MLEMTGLIGAVRGDRLFERANIFRVDAPEPLRRVAGRFVRCQPKHRLPPKRKVHDAVCRVPVPDAVVRTGQGQRVTLFADSQRFLCRRAIGNVTHKPGETPREWQQPDVQNAAGTARHEFDTLKLGCSRPFQRGGDRRRNAGVEQRGNGFEQLSIQNVLSTNARDALDRVVPQFHHFPMRQHEHALVERLDDLAMSTFIFEAPCVCLIGAVGDVQRSQGQRNKGVSGPIDSRCSEDGGAGSDEVTWSAPQEVVMPHVRDSFAR